jgi:hypothetical protein
MVFEPSTICWLQLGTVSRLNELDIALMSTAELVDWLGTYVTCVWTRVPLESKGRRL